MFHNQFLNVGVGSFYRMSQFLQTLQKNMNSIKILECILVKNYFT